ncbi:MAG TPA: glycoside hydrolase family 3 N-terminal domain-containing protein [Salinimicrobium sp.]|nr:glycoside hydrolase family 3 N-terminal domain-containing protein [Salinimicrobium sp.]
MILKKISFLFLYVLAAIPVFAQKQTSPLIAPDYQQQVHWVDSIYHSMTLEEKVGQLFMVDIFSNKTKAEVDKIKDLIRDYHIGGVIFSKGGPQQQAKINNEFQELAKVPLLIGMDAEWGLAMRLDSTYAFPWNMTLGAIRDNSLIEKVGAQIGRHNKRMGVHINFAPVVDINTNPDNPIIGNRSFGENKINVTEKALAFMKGMQGEGVLASAKHFPGHGDTDTDSHKTLPTINFSKKRIEEVELFPYRKLIKEGVASVMVGHLNVPSLESRQNFPSSLSKTIVTGILKEKMDFNGLIFTDALNMKGVANFDSPGDIDLAAFTAGNDILLISEDVPKASQKLIEAFQNGKITKERLAHSVRKILFAKYKVGLNNYQPVDTLNLIADLNSLENDVLYSELIENAITVVKNNKGIIPVKDLEKTKVAYVKFGDDDGTAFYNQLQKYTKVDTVSAAHLDELNEKLENYNYVIIGFHKSDANPWKDYKFTEQEQVWLYEIARKNRVVLTVFARPYALSDLSSTTNFEGLIMAYQNSRLAQEKAAQIIFGAIGAKGILPVSVGKESPEGTGYLTPNINRLSYGLPESVGLDSEVLSKIDSIANVAMSEEMTPGMQILVARKGKVVYDKNFGYHTYEKEKPVEWDDVYDLASLTKILATLPLVMELEEDHVITLNTKIKELLPKYKKTNKGNISLKELLSHYAGLEAWIPFYRMTMKEGDKPSVEYYRDQESKGFRTQVADRMYIRDDIRDSISNIIKNSELSRKITYKYSDLGYYILKNYLEEYYDTSLDYLTQENFYEALGANHLGYLPLNKFSKEKIIPTEDDKLWRRQLVHGYVHDQGAAMQGGIGGHAGLFSNANDVAKMMQMYLNGGTYGGKNFFEQETIDKFNTCYYCSENVRRGVGFDKPQLEEVGPTCGCVSMTSFGHSGFTGTFAWADPEEEIVYVFLSNRIYPDAENKKLITEDIRTKIQEVIYQAIQD